MSSKGLTFLAFIAGAGIGSVCTWQLLKRDIVNIGLHFFLKNVRPYAASCSEA